VSTPVFVVFSPGLAGEPLVPPAAVQSVPQPPVERAVQPVVLGTSCSFMEIAGRHPRAQIDFHYFVTLNHDFD